MYTTRIHAPPALTGIAAAAVVALAAGPAIAGHGLEMSEHPLRGGSPTANDAASSTSADDDAAAGQVARQRDEPGGWLRGDFPLAAESRPEQASPETATTESASTESAVVERGIGETWSCTVQSASAQDAGSGPQAVMRVLHLPQ